MIRWIGWGLLVACIIVVAGPAGAQLSGEDPGRIHVEDVRIEDPVEPLGEPAKALAQVIIPCEAGEDSTAWTKARFTTPAYTRASAPSITNETSQTCQGETAVVHLPIEVGFEKTAPAFDPVTASLHVTVQKNHTDGETTRFDPAKASLSATPGYFSLFNAQMSDKTIQAGPQEAARYDILIENYSNGLTRFEFEFAHEEGIPQGFNPILPEPLLLPGATSEDEPTTETVTFVVYTPFYNGYVNENAAITFQIDTAFAEDQAFTGENATLTTLTNVQGLHVPTPASLTLLALAAASAAGTLARRP